jgi:hypothetical protein
MSRSLGSFLHGHKEGAGSPWRFVRIERRCAGHRKGIDMSKGTDAEIAIAENDGALKKLTDDLSLLFMAAGDLERLVLRVRRQARDLGWELEKSDGDE